MVFGTILSSINGVIGFIKNNPKFFLGVIFALMVVLLFKQCDKVKNLKYEIKVKEVEYGNEKNRFFNNIQTLKDSVEFVEGDNLYIKSLLRVKEDELSVMDNQLESARINIKVLANKLDDKSEVKNIYITEISSELTTNDVMTNIKKDSLGNFSAPLGTKNNNFYHYLKKNLFSRATKSEIAKAVKGIGGMMKFSNHNSPILLEALGDLLSNAENGFDPGAGHLSSRAYLKAALLSKKEDAINGYKKRANEERERQFAGENRQGIEPYFSSHVISLKDLEVVLKLEIQAANVWVEEIKENELAWISRGLNPDSAFTVTYYKEPTSKAIVKHAARRNKNQIEEEYWLNQQLKNIKQINSAFNILQLPDSTKNWVDSIYKVAFSALPEKVEEAEIYEANKLDKNKNLNGDRKGIWIIILSVGGMVVIILGTRFLLRK